MKIVLLFVDILISIVYSLPADCEQNGQNVFCKISLPKQLPKGTKEVVIQGQIGNTNGSWYTEKTFGDASWTSVTKLDVTVQDHPGYIFLEDNIFRNLISLQYLEYHDPTLQTIQKSAFDGLTNLTALDLSDCVLLQGRTLINALNQSLPHIDTLVINNIQNKFSYRFQCDRSFWNIIHEKKIKTLGLSKINSILFWTDLKDKQFMLESVNMSSSRLLPLFDNITIENVLLLAKQSVFQHLKNFDMSYFFIGEQDSINITGENISTLCDNDFSNMFFALLGWFEHFYADGILFQPTYLDRTFVDLSNCKISLQVIHGANNHIQKANETVKYPENMTIYEIDLSNNEVTYMSPSLLSSSLPLKNLYLSSNRLGEMQSTPEFPVLFTGLATLERLTLANNSFNHKPLHMFDKNSNLKVLDLSSNSLDSVTFETRHLIAMEILDLSRNKISILDSNTIARLDQLLVKNTTSDKSSYVDINLEGNPFACSCESIHTLKWLAEFQMISQRNLYCKQGGNTVRINAEALLSAQNSCPKTKLIIASTVSSICGLIVLVIVLIVLIQYKKKGQLKHAVERYVENYKQNNDQNVFVAMLSYSSQDDYNLIKYIYQNLGQPFEANTSS